MEERGERASPLRAQDHRLYPHRLRKCRDEVAARPSYRRKSRIQTRHCSLPVEFDPEERFELYEDAGRTLVAEVPAVFVHTVSNRVLVKPNVTGCSRTTPSINWPGWTNLLTVDVEWPRWVLPPVQRHHRSPLRAASHSSHLHVVVPVTLFGLVRLVQ